MAKPKPYRSLYVNDKGGVELDRAVKVCISLPRSVWKMVMDACRNTYMRPSNLIAAVINVKLNEFVSDGSADKYLKNLTVSGQKMADPPSEQ